MLHGNVSDEARSFFFGATLVALLKPSGGVRPIVVGYTLRCLIAKVASRMVKCEMAQLLSPRQLGYGVCGGAEAAVHAERRFLGKMAASHYIHWDKMLEATHDLTPDIYPFVTPPTPPPHISSGVTGLSFQLRVYSRVTLWGVCCFV